MKIKICRPFLSAIAAVSVSVFAFADGGPNDSKAVDGKSLALEEFQGSDTLMNRAWQFRLGDDASWASVDCDDAKWRWLDLPHDFQFELPWDKGARPAHGYKPLKVAWYRRHFKAAPRRFAARHPALEGAARRSDAKGDFRRIRAARARS